MKSRNYLFNKWLVLLSIIYILIATANDSNAQPCNYKSGEAISIASSGGNSYFATKYILVNASTNIITYGPNNTPVFNGVAAGNYIAYAVNYDSGSVSPNLSIGTNLNTLNTSPTSCTSKSPGLPVNVCDCNNSSQTLNPSVTGGFTSPFANKYIMTNGKGIIEAVQDSLPFMNVDAGIHNIYALNYYTPNGSPSGLSIGANISGAGGSCSELSQGIGYIVCISISGSVYNDPNGLTNSKLDGTKINKPSNTQLYANLVDSLTGNVLASMAIDTLGNYKFENVNANYAYKVVISTNAGTIGNPVLPNLPMLWGNTSEGLVTTGDGNANGIINIHTQKSNITYADFGIEQLPVADAKAYTGIDPRLFPATSGNSTYPYLLNLNNGGSNGNVSLSNGTLPGRVSGKDTTDGIYAGTNTGNTRHTIVFTNLPDSNYNVLAYDGVALIPFPDCSSGFSGACQFWDSINQRYEIPNFDADLLQLYMKPASSNVNTASFNYAWRDSAGLMGSAALYQINGYIPLPISLLKADAYWDDQDAVINWTTSNEINSEKFEVERSIDGKSFEYINSIDAANSSTVEINYQYIDKNVKKMINGEVFYRLKLVDLDKKYIYSSIMILNTTIKHSLSEINIYPNPSVNILNVDFKVELNEKIEIQVLDMLGRTLIKTQVLNRSNQLDISDLPAGIYHIVLVGNNKENIVKEFVKVSY